MKSALHAIKDVTVSGDDVIKVDPKHYSIEFENDRVRVVRIKYGPRERSAMHGHPEGVVIYLRDIHVRFTYPDGKTEEVTGKAGQAMWTPPITHLPENLEGEPMELILVELKGNKTGARKK
jgi:quercetin dioxygenase-like cupin family protein